MALTDRVINYGDKRFHARCFHFLTIEDLIVRKKTDFVNTQESKTNPYSACQQQGKECPAVQNKVFIKVFNSMLLFGMKLLHLVFPYLHFHFGSQQGPVSKRGMCFGVDFSTGDGGAYVDDLN